MKNKLKKLAAGIMFACIMAVFAPYQLSTALAANGKLTFSDPSVTVGNEFSVTMKITSTSEEALGGADVTLSYDPSAIEFLSGTNASGGAGSVRLLGSMESTDTKVFSFTLKFKALQAGSSKITVSTQEVYDINTQSVTMDHVGNSTVTVNPLATYSTDASLKSLKVSPGNLVPEFSPEVESYTLEVGGDVDKIAVSAQTNDDKAKLVITGHSDLKIGENPVSCKVTAEDGQTVKTYQIMVNKSETIPEETGEVEGGLVDGTQLIGSSVSLTILPLESGVTVPEGFEAGTVDINGQTVDCWVLASSESDYQYCIFYGQDQNGEKGFYRYDLEKKTLQRYFQNDGAGISKEGYEEMVIRYNSLVEDYDTRFIIMIALIVLSAVLVVAVIVLLMKKGGRSYDRYDDDEEDDDQYAEPALERRNMNKAARMETAAARREKDFYPIQEEEEDLPAVEEWDEEENFQEEIFEEEDLSEEKESDDDDFEILDLF